MEQGAVLVRAYGRGQRPGQSALRPSAARLPAGRGGAVLAQSPRRRHPAVARRSRRRGGSGPAGRRGCRDGAGRGAAAPPGCRRDRCQRYRAAPAAAVRERARPRDPQRRNRRGRGLGTDEPPAPRRRPADPARRGAAGDGRRLRSAAAVRPGRAGKRGNGCRLALWARRPARARLRRPVPHRAAHRAAGCRDEAAAQLDPLGHRRAARAVYCSSRAARRRAAGIAGADRRQAGRALRRSCRREFSAVAFRAGARTGPVRTGAAQRPVAGHAHRHAVGGRRHRPVR